MRTHADASYIERIVDKAPDFLRYHLEGTGDLARRWAMFLRLDAEEVEVLAAGAYAHDIGKLVIPVELLLKPASLTEDEVELVRRHVDTGIGILRGLGDISPRVLTVVAQHHERMDGFGYPLGLYAESIDPLSRRLSIVDAFCAMTEKRPYQESRSEWDAMDELLRCAGAQFDPDFVDEFALFLAHEHE